MLLNVHIQVKTFDPNIYKAALSILLNRKDRAGGKDNGHKHR